MRIQKTILFVAATSLTLAACGDTVGGGTRSEIRAVGSSTVFPFAKAVSESFVLSNPNFSSPLIESTGTGGNELILPGSRS